MDTVEPRAPAGAPLDFTRVLERVEELQGYIAELAAMIAEARQARDARQATR